MDNLRSALINPEESQGVIRPDIRPASRLSVQTTADSAGIDNVEDFSFRPAPQDEQIKCRISRDRKGIDNRAYPVYYLHLERDGQKKVYTFIFVFLYYLNFLLKNHFFKRRASYHFKVYYNLEIGQCPKPYVKNRNVKTTYNTYNSV